MTDGSLRKFYVWFTVLGLLVGGLVVLALLQRRVPRVEGLPTQVHQRGNPARLDAAAAGAGRKNTDSNPPNPSARTSTAWIAARPAISR